MARVQYCVLSRPCSAHQRYCRYMRVLCCAAHWCVIKFLVQQPQYFVRFCDTKYCCNNYLLYSRMQRRVTKAIVSQKSVLFSAWTWTLFFVFDPICTLATPRAVNTESPFTLVSFWTSSGEVFHCTKERCVPHFFLLFLVWSNNDPYFINTNSNIPQYIQFNLWIEIR